MSDSVDRGAKKTNGEARPGRAYSGTICDFISASIPNDT